MGYSFLADVVVALHLGYISFVLIGELAILLGIVFRWNWIRNPWFRWLHLLAILIVAVEALLNITCPLTVLEDKLRDWAHQETTGMSFIGRCLDSIIFCPASESLLTIIYIAFALLVLTTFWLAPPRRRQRVGT